MSIHPMNRQLPEIPEKQPTTAPSPTQIKIIKGSKDDLSKINFFGDPKFAFAFKKIKSRGLRGKLKYIYKQLRNKFDFNYVILTIHEGEKKYDILVKVEELFKKLYLTESDIKKAFEKGELVELIKNQSTRIKTLQEQTKVLEKLKEQTNDLKKPEEQKDPFLQETIEQEAIKHYETILAKYTESPSGELVAKEGTLKTGLNKKTLMKVVKLAVETFHAKPTKPFEITVGGKKFLAEKKGEMLNLIDIQNKMELGKGVFGIAYTIKNISAATIQVLKTPRLDIPEKAEKAKKDLINEYNKLNEIHSTSPDGNPVIGIQLPPHTIFEITGSQPQMGFIGVKYDTDLWDLLYKNTLGAVTDDTKHNACLQLWTGLEKLEKIEIKHGDIKPENIFVKQNEDETYRFDIADFGRSKKLDELDKLIENINMSGIGEFEYRHIVGNCSSKYRPIEDDDHLLKQSLLPEIKKSCQASDVFAMGLVMYEILTGKYPFPLEEDQTPILKDTNGHYLINVEESDFMKGLRNKNFSDELIDLLKSTLDPTPIERPKASEVRETFENLYKGKKIFKG